MHSKSMHVLVTFNRGVCFTTINFSLRNISVPCYLRLPCNCVLSEFFIFRFNKGTTQLSSSEHLALWSPSLISRIGLRGQQGDVHIQDDKAAHFLLWGGTKVKDISGQVLCLFVVCGLLLMTSAVTLVMAKFNFP